MQKLWNVGVGLVFIAGSANAQFVVDTSARTISIDYVTISAVPLSFSQGFSGTLNTSGLATLYGVQPVTLRFDPFLTGPGGAYSANQMPLLVNAYGGSVPDIPGSLVATIGATFRAGANSGVPNEDYAAWSADEEFLSGPAGWGQYFGTDFGVRFPMTVQAGAVVPFSMFLSGTSRLGGFGDGATAQFFGTIGLAGVTAYDASGNELATALFDDQGNGYFTAPEPTSIALLGTGLLGVLPFARRRRRASTPESADCPAV